MFLICYICCFTFIIYTCPGGDVYKGGGGGEYEEKPLINNKMYPSSPPGVAVSNLPSISRVEKETAILQAAVFIEDGVNYRSIFHKLDPQSLRVYRIYHSRWIQWSLAVVIFVFLILAFFEYPTSLSISSDPTIRKHVPYFNNPPCGVTESIEFICLVLFAVDCGVKFYLLGWRRFIQRKWLVLYLVMIVLSFPDMFVSLGFCPTDVDNDTPSLGYTLRLRRFFRPLIFLLSSSIMKKLAKAIKLTLPQIFNVLVLLVLHLYVFTMIGLLMFPGTQSQSSPSDTINNSLLTNGSWFFAPNTTDAEDCFTTTCFLNQEGDTYFHTVWDGFVNLTVTLTTANHPDIMMPIYRRNRFAALYFIIFLIIGLFLLFNVLIAVIYNQFKGFFQKSLQGSFFRRRVAYRAAFTILLRKTRIPGRRNLDLVGRDLVRMLLQTAKIDQRVIPHMYQRLETMDTEGGDCIRWEQFCEVFDLASSRAGSRYWRGRRKETRPFYCRNRVLGWIQFIVRHRYFRWYTHLVTMLNLLLVSIELQRTDLRDRNSLLVIYNFIFILYYAIEQVFRVAFLGFREYFSTLGNIYDLIITMVLVLLQLLATALFSSPFQRHNIVGGYDSLIRLMNVFIVLRLLRFVPHIKRLWMLTNTMVALIRNLRGFAGIIIVVYYMFALLGMEIFSNAKIVNPDNVNECGSYDNLGYYANNFNDFASSLVVLWDIMIVNNWYVFLNKFARDSYLQEWSKLYFIAWWLVSVVVCVNLFISLVLETFLVQWQATLLTQEQQEEAAREEGRVGYADSHMFVASAVNSEGREVRRHSPILSVTSTSLSRIM